MSNKLIINNQKIKLIENRSSLDIKKGKLILSEDVTDVSTEQAFGMISDTGKSLVNIGEGILKMYVSQMKLGLNFLLLPLTRNLGEIIKSYEQDIGEVNKLFADSIPSNVQKTSQLINVSANPSNFVFSKIFDNLQKVEGVSQVVNAKNIGDVILPPPLQNIVNVFYEKGKDIPGGMWQTVTKDLPEYFKIEGSSYSSLDKESTELKDLNDEINRMFGGRTTSSDRGISGLKIKSAVDYENIALDIINSIRLATIKQTVSSFFNADENCVNFFHIILNSKSNKSSPPLYNDPGFNRTTYPDNKFYKAKAEANPPVTDYVIRQKIEGMKISGKEVFLTIKKDLTTPGSAGYDEADCYFSLDDDTGQMTEDISFEIFF